MSEPNDIEYEDGSDNVFADLGFDASTATRLIHKAELVGILHRLQQERNLSQSAFSRLVGIPQPQLSKLYNGKVVNMPTSKLLDAIARLGDQVDHSGKVQPCA